MQSAESILTTDVNSPKLESKASRDPLPYGALIKKRNAFKRKLASYLRVKAKNLSLLENKPAENSSAAAAEEAPVSKELCSYKLLRNLCVTYNWLNLGKDERKLGVPSLFEKELSSSLGAEVYQKYKDALEAPLDEFAAKLPESVDSSALKKISEFVSS